METQVALCIGDDNGKAFHYYNCSESGILGVVAKSMEKKDFKDKSNWMLMVQHIPETMAHHETERCCRTISESERLMDLPTKKCGGRPGGNPSRCRQDGCISLAGKDGYCKRCRPPELTEQLPLVRDEFKPYGAYFGKEGFYKNDFSIIKDKFDLER